MQAYSDPKRESDPHALPDVEVFYCDFHEAAFALPCDSTDDPAELVGWYWQPCFPGCLPDGDPIGPFASEAEALADAREGASDDPGCDVCGVNDRAPGYSNCVGCMNKSE